MAITAPDFSRRYAACRQSACCCLRMLPQVMMRQRYYTITYSAMMRRKCLRQARHEDGVRSMCRRHCCCACALCHAVAFEICCRDAARVIEQRVDAVLIRAAFDAAYTHAARDAASMPLCQRRAYATQRERIARYAGAMPHAPYSARAAAEVRHARCCCSWRAAAMQQVASPGLCCNDG